MDIVFFAPTSAPTNLAVLNYMCNGRAHAPLFPRLWICPSRPRVTLRFTCVVPRARAQPLRPAVLAPALDTVLYCARACIARARRDHLCWIGGLRVRLCATVVILCECIADLSLRKNSRDRYAGAIFEKDNHTKFAIGMAFHTSQTFN